MTKRESIANIAYPLKEKNVFIVGMGGKMVKIRVTGEKTFDWLEARFDDRSPIECWTQSSFNEYCFDGRSVDRTKLNVKLIARIK